MIKSNHFDSFFAQVVSKKLSKISNRKHLQGSITSWSLVQQRIKLDTRCGSRGLSKPMIPFERDIRNVSSLTTRIDCAHLQHIGHEHNPGEYAKKARGLAVHSDSISLSMCPFRDSGEEPTMVQGEVNES